MTEYAERFARQKIKVEGQIVEVLIMGPGAELPIGPNLSEEMDRVAAQLGYWGAVLADAVGELKKVDAWYRNFRAEVTAACLGSDPKMAEWKVKAKIEGSKGFLQWKESIALAEKNVRLCEGMVRAFDKKANQLQSKGAKMRTELNAQGMTTPADEPEERGWNLSGEGSEHDDDDVPSPTVGVERPSPEDALARMEEINAGRAKKSKSDDDKDKKKSKKKATKGKKSKKRRSE